MDTVNVGLIERTDSLPLNPTNSPRTPRLRVRVERKCRHRNALNSRCPKCPMVRIAGDPPTRGNSHIAGCEFKSWLRRGFWSTLADSPGNGPIFNARSAARLNIQQTSAGVWNLACRNCVSIGKATSFFSLDRRCDSLGHLYRRTRP